MAEGRGISLPVPSAPPYMISPQTSNEDVKLWVYHRLRRLDAYITEEEAWALARRVIGDGEVILSYGAAEWEKELPRHGQALFHSFQQTNKYVMDGVFDFLLVCQALLLLVASGSGVGEFIKKETFHLTKLLGIIFLIYTFILRILQTILSSKWAHRSARLPGCLRMRRRVDHSIWKDFAGIPK